MVSFSVTDANSEKAKQSVIDNAKKFIVKNSDFKYSLCKLALDNNGKIFEILCKEEDDCEECSQKEDLAICQITAISVDDKGRISPLGTFVGELAKNDFSYGCKLKSYYENNGIGREIMLFWENLVYEFTESENIDIIAVNGKKNIPWYKSLGYSTVEVFKTKFETDPDTKVVTEIADTALMTKNLTVKDFFKHKASEKSHLIFESSSDDTKAFIKSFNEEISEYISEIKRGILSPVRKITM